MSHSEGPSVAVVTRPSSADSFVQPIDRFLTILEPTAGELALVGGNYVVESVDVPLDRTGKTGDGTYVGLSAVDHVILQLLVALELVLLRDADLVYFHKGTMAFAFPVLVARLLGSNPCLIKIGAFYGERGIASSTYAERILSLLQCTAFRWASAVVVFTDSERDGIPNDDVFVAYSNYRDFDTFSPGAPLEERPFDVGFVGRFTDIKRVDELAEAVEELVTDDGLTACLVGDGPMFEDIEDRIGNLESVDLTGWIDQAELPSYIGQMRTLVLPSRAEGLPTTVIEAMGCEVVILATPVGGIPDLVRNGETGYLLADGNAEGIVAGYRRVNACDDLAAIAARARREVVSKYPLPAAQENFSVITHRVAD